MSQFSYIFLNGKNLVTFFLMELSIKMNTQSHQIKSLHHLLGCVFRRVLILFVDFYCTYIQMIILMLLINVETTCAFFCIVNILTKCLANHIGPVNSSPQLLVCCKMRETRNLLYFQWFYGPGLEIQSLGSINCISFLYFSGKSALLRR